MGDDDDGDAYDPNKTRKKTAGQQITVKKGKW
jgi:hypothetical protein